MASMTSAMEDVIYEKHDFNGDMRARLEVDVLAEKHLLYHLEDDEFGGRQCVRDQHGEPICSPRCLRDICLYVLTTDSPRWQHVCSHLLPTNVFPLLLREAVAQRELSAIQWTIAHWPLKFLRVFDVIPVEDLLDDDCLTKPLISGLEKTCIADGFVRGLLKKKPECNLRLVDFSGFEKDRQLCRELCRLPVLWMKREDRTVDRLHQYISESLIVTKDKVEHFLNRISLIYSNVDGEVPHGAEIGPITLHLDLRIDLDDVPIGLSLQRYSPFEFSCNRFWIKHVPDAELLPSNIGAVMDPSMLTHFEFEEPMLSQTPSRVRGLIDALSCMPNLFALSLPESMDIHISRAFLVKINAAMRKMKYLHRLNFAYCNLQGMLSVLLGNLRCRLVYLNLKDCRLVADDFLFLLHWRPIARLRELNLSCNNLVLSDQVFEMMLEKMPFLSCLSVAHCSLSVESLLRISRACKECGRLKVLSMQPFTPIDLMSTFDILQVCAQIKTQQKVLLFPEVYAFPGNNDWEREQNKMHAMGLCYRHLASLQRPDIELE